MRDLNIRRVQETRFYTSDGRSFHTHALAIQAEIRSILVDELCTSTELSIDAAESCVAWMTMTSDTVTQLRNFLNLLLAIGNESEHEDQSIPLSTIQKFLKEE